MFDVDTRDAVYAFQRDYGLVPTGVIDEATWNKIVNAYYYVLANAEVSEPYPGRTALARLAGRQRAVHPDRAQRRQPACAGNPERRGRRHLPARKQKEP